jgi:hypothetical protein
MGNENRGSDAGASPIAQGLTHQPALNIVARLREEHGAGLAGDALGLEAAAEIERLLGANIVLLAGLHEICEPITAMGDADSVSACQDLHELICMTAQDAIAKARTWAAPTSKSDAQRAFEKAMAPRENPLHPIFRDHNCWKCRDGSLPCKHGYSRQCEYPHARND